MIEADSAYLTKRAETELEHARRAARTDVAQVHQRPAEAYLEQLKLETRPTFEQAT